MKKVLAVMLSVLMLFSCFAVAAFAEGGEEIKNPVVVTVKFKTYDADGNGEADDGVVAKVFEKDAAIESAVMQEWLYDMPREFSVDYEVTEDGYTRTETKTYTFKYFTKEGDESGETYYFGSTDAITEDTVFVAQYKIEDTIDYVTFWELVESIFARINRIFEYFAAIFNF